MATVIWEVSDDRGLGFRSSLFFMPSGATGSQRTGSEGQMDEKVIAIIAMVGGFSIPLFWFYFDYKAKARRARVAEKALEVGASPEEVMRALEVTEGQTKEEKAAARRMPYRKGLVLCAIGAAMLFSVEHHAGEREMSVPGTILLFLGLAFLLSDFLNRKSFRE